MLLPPVPASMAFFSKSSGSSSYTPIALGAGAGIVFGFALGAPAVGLVIGAGIGAFLPKRR